MQCGLFSVNNLNSFAVVGLHEMDMKVLAVNTTYRPAGVRLYAKDLNVQYTIITVSPLLTGRICFKAEGQCSHISSDNQKLCSEKTSYGEMSHTSDRLDPCNRC